MSTTSAPLGPVVLGALAVLSFGVFCASASQVSALEYESEAAPARALELHLAPSAGRDQAVRVVSSGKWAVDLDSTASRSFSESDIRDTGLSANHQATWLLGAQVKLSGHNLFFADDKLSLSVGVPLQTSAGRVRMLNGIFVRGKRDMRVRDLVLSMINNNLWSLAASHKLPTGYKPLRIGYGLYAQFRGDEFKNVGLGLSSRLRF